MKSNPLCCLRARLPRWFKPGHAAWILAMGSLVLARGEGPTWSNGLPTDPGFFPIGVWLQPPSRAQAYRDAGINLYVGLWKGPTEEQLTV